MNTLKQVISEAIFGWDLRNDDGNNLSMDDTDEIAEYIMAQAPQPAVPEGYVLVPQKLTQLMLEAWYLTDRTGSGLLAQNYQAAYDELLSAAKEPI